MTELCRSRPDALHWHVEPTSHPLSPLRCHGRFAPVVGDAHDLTVNNVAQPFADSLPRTSLAEKDTSSKKVTNDRIRHDSRRDLAYRLSVSTFRDLRTEIRSPVIPSFIPSIGATVGNGRTRSATETPGSEPVRNGQRRSEAALKRLSIRRFWVRNPGAHHFIAGHDRCDYHGPVRTIALTATDVRTSRGANEKPMLQP